MNDSYRERVLGGAPQERAQASPGRRKWSWQEANMGMQLCAPFSALHRGDASPTFFPVSGGLRNWAFRGVSSLLKRRLGSLALVTEKMLLFAMVAIAMLLGTRRPLALRWERESLLPGP